MPPGDARDTLTTDAPPLQAALQATRGAEQDEQRLAERHTALKGERQRLNACLQDLQRQCPLLDMAGDRERRRQVEELMGERDQVEAERSAAYAQAAVASKTLITAAERYRELHAESQRWLQAMHYHQAQALRGGWARGDALDHTAGTQDHLAQLIGQDAAARLASDPELPLDAALGES